MSHGPDTICLICAGRKGCLCMAYRATKYEICDQCRQKGEVMRIELQDRYGPDETAPAFIEVPGNDFALAQHIAHVVQEWQWPGQEHMYEVVSNPEMDCQDCPCLVEQRAEAEKKFQRLKAAMYLLR
jgi:hypothetical protein